METGIAMGGPRNGVKLTAAAVWDGRVAEPAKEGAIRMYYPGRYRWSANVPGWIWQVAPPQRRAGTGRPQQ